MNGNILLFQTNKRNAGTRIGQAQHSSATASDLKAWKRRADCATLCAVPTTFRAWLRICFCMLESCSCIRGSGDEGSEPFDRRGLL